MTEIIDLRPDRTLLNTVFEKYQFCNDSAPVVLEKKLEKEISHLEPSSSQDSWLEVRLFAFHNHLFKNPYDNSCWFVDDDGGIWRCMDDGPLVMLHSITNYAKKDRLNSTYNPSIVFASKEITVISDGINSLMILTGTTKEDVNISVLDEVEPVTLFDARHVKDSSKLIICVYSIKEVDGKKKSELSFLSYTFPLSIKPELLRKQILVASGPVEYVYIGENGNYFHTITPDGVKFKYDSLKSIKETNPSVNSINIPKYCWSQDDESITVWVKIPEKYSASKPTIDTSPMGLTITVDDEILIKGDTPNRLEEKLTTWKCKDGTLEIELFKSESGLMWCELLKGDTGGEYVPNESLAAEIHLRLAHLCSEKQEEAGEGQPAMGFNSEQLEECDLQGGDNVLQKIDLENHATTHVAMLGNSNRVIFTEKLSSGQALCLRNEHDGCVWVPKMQDNRWNVKHVQTFPGFGYVEASKSNKKFCISPSDGSYVAIVEHTRHAFLYDKPESNATIGKQRILDFGAETSPIIGAVATNKYLIVLTKDTLYHLQDCS